MLVGHADPRGTDEYNLDLGLRRAESAAGFLDSLGVRVQRLTTESLGEEDRVTDEDTEAAYARDRRVQFHYCDPRDPEARFQDPCGDVLSPAPGAAGAGSFDDTDPGPAARDGPAGGSAEYPARPTQKR